ncbi:MAG: phosphate ABC transporter permease subunit PstC [Propionibacteriaceae bacterium]|nr:phosphate ABC transporter permease subunit PstC [Propionibacteriaceae bacterium]
MSIAIALPTSGAEAVHTARRHVGDRVWKSVTWAAGITTILILGGVVAFLVIDGAPALSGTADTLPSHVSNIWRLTSPLLFGSAWSSAWALLFATPVGIGFALFVTQVAPRRLGTVLGSAIDLLAAVPSVVYGLWGLFVVAPVAARVYAWLSAHLGWIPLFSGTPSATGRTVLTASLVLAIMVLPMVATLSREVISLVPKTNIEAALALGSTRWQAIRLAVLPQAKSGIVAGALLALGRALGETMAVAMVLSPSLKISIGLINSQNPGTVAAFIAQNFPDASGLQINALLWLGLMLFVLTFVINSTARAVIRRQKV